MEKLIAKNIYPIKELKVLVISKLRTLGFGDVSETSLIENDTHRSLFIDAMETELTNLESLKKELLDTLQKVKAKE